MFGWSAGVGDPTLIGWLTMLAYFGTAVLCIRASGNRPSTAGRWSVWHLLFVILLLLGINKQLDVQTLLTGMGRQIARDGGWYRQRGPIQLAFISGIAVAAAVAIALLFALIDRADRHARSALAGLVVLLAFVVMRATSFHDADVFLRLNVSAFRLYHVLELGGICLIAIPALRAGNRRPGVGAA
ncbi:hypothetical protein [Sphingomonas sp. FW199]|uniref:hypothetical protein n=1 Tax=Sphingomonas sp. FW199 TaxID=3400217 RepID=UPI003CF8BD6F